MARLLLIEDDRETAAEITAALGTQGDAIGHAADGVAGLDLARTVK